MLQGKPLRLHNIEDAEGFVADFITRRGLRPPPPWTHEDFLADLVSYVWELSVGKEYDSSRSSFSTFVTLKLSAETVNWMRRKAGRTKWQFADRTYERVRPEFVEFDEFTVGAAAVDSVEHRDPDERGLHDDRTVSAASYLPPASVRSVGGILESSNREPDRVAEQQSEAA